MEVLGIDIGGSGIKAAPVDVEKGEFSRARKRIPTPQPSRPDAVAEVVRDLLQHFDWQGPVGCTFPAIVRHGVIKSAANVDDSWIGVNGEALLRDVTGQPVRVLNDADAAGIAEARFGAGRDQEGVIVLLTLGTGIGSAILVDGHLLPNTEFGHLPIRGKEAEHRAANSVRKAEDLSWAEWGKRLNEFLQRMEFFFSPDLFIIGGGVSKKHEKFFRYLETEAPIVPATLRNQAGIIGAAFAASQANSQREADTIDAEKQVNSE